MKENTTSNYKYLEVIRLADRKVVRRLDMKGRSEREIEKIERGLLRNMSEDYAVGEETYSTPQKAI